MHVNNFNTYNSNYKKWWKTRESECCGLGFYKRELWEFVLAGLSFA
jgi:hypothetical protein